jgi:outer membrane murein-binding lipoprotein Lpp
MEKSKKVMSAGLMLAAVAAATYFLTGKRGRANRDKIAAWTLDLKAEVLRRMRQLKVINREVYHELVDEVAARYQRVGRVSTTEMRHLIEEVKGAWTHISRQLK